MATLHTEIFVSATPDEIWDALRDVGALHTRLVPGFVVNTVLEDGARVVTFGNGMVVREPIVSVDDARRRLVWGATGGRATHYNAAVQVFAEAGGSRVVWTTDFLPHDLEAFLSAAQDKGLSTLKRTLEGTSRER